MAVTNTEHAPAAGIALDLVINIWNADTIVSSMQMLWMVAVRHMLHSRLMNLTALPS